MAKRRTTIIIEEIVGEDKSTKVFVSGNNAETLTEAKSITPRKKSTKTSTKKKTTSKKKKTTSEAAKKSTSANLQSKATKSKTAKAKSTSKTNNKKASNTKTKKSTKSKTTSDKVQNKDKNTSNPIEKPAELHYIQENQTETAFKEETNLTSKNEVQETNEITQSTSLEPITKQEISLTNKEVINNPEIIDKEDNKENIGLDFTDKEKKTDLKVLNAKATVKENKEEPIEEKTETNKEESKKESSKQNNESQNEGTSASSTSPATLNEENEVTKVDSNPLIINESDSKEKVDGEVIDSENTKESKEAKNKDNDKLDTIDVDIVDTTDEKDNEKAKIDEVENSKDSKNQISTTSFTNPISAKETNETTSYSSTALNLETPKEAKQEINEKQGGSKDEDKTKQSSRFKISLNPLSLIAKLLKNKTYRGAIIGTSLLVILVAILVPVSINANKETKELSEDEFNSLKDSFVKEDEFFNELTSLSFTFSQFDEENLNTTIVKLEYEYTFDGSYYSSNLKSYDTKENEPSIYNINFDKDINSYALTTSLDNSVEPITLNEEEAIQMIGETSSSYFKDYLSFNSIFVNSLLEDETIKLTYEQNKKSGDLCVFDKENGLFDIKLDSLGIITSLRAYDENSKDKPLYSLDINYLFNKWFNYPVHINLKQKSNFDEIHGDENNK